MSIPVQAENAIVCSLFLLLLQEDEKKIDSKLMSNENVDSTSINEELCFCLPSFQPN
jgi:hypothetical protein